MPKKYNHAFGIGFSVNTTHKDDEKVPEHELIAALKARVDDLMKNPGEILEACGKAWDSYDYEEAEYAFDIKLNAVARVTAGSQPKAGLLLRQIESIPLEKEISTPDGTIRLTEVSIDLETMKPNLFEVDGEIVGDN